MPKNNLKNSNCTDLELSELFLLLLHAEVSLGLEGGAPLDTVVLPGQIPSDGRLHGEGGLLLLEVAAARQIRPHIGLNFHDRLSEDVRALLLQPPLQRLPQEHPMSAQLIILRLPTAKI